jgi:membrane-associated phospholipid phosphatase
MYLKGVIFIPAILTAAQRILQDVHWTSDVFMGASIGYFVSSYIVNKHNQSFENEQSVRFIPGFDLNGRFNLVILF